MNPCITSALAFALLGTAACATGQEPGYYSPPPVAMNDGYAPPPYGNPRYDAAPAYRPVSCDIRVRNTRNGVEITPVAYVDRSVSGAYDLVVTKSGASGESDVTQGGPFRARAGEKVTLGETEISVGRRDRYRAVLKVFDGGRQICRTEVRS